MRRLDYLNSTAGQITLQRARQLNTLHCMLEGHEPRSKNSISSGEKIAFQAEVLKYMTGMKRRYFRAPVSIEFDFFPTKPNPPAAHTLPKNYLDLLSHPNKGVVTNRKRIVFEDDRQVQYLAVRYHIGHGQTRPSIWMRTAPYRDLVADLAMLESIRNGSIAGDGNRRSFGRQASSWNELCDENGSRQDDYSAIESLRTLERDKHTWVARFGEQTYKIMHTMKMREAQNQLLRALSMTPDKLICLLSPLFAGRNAQCFEDLHATTRQLMISPPFAIDLAHHNLKEAGDSTRYREMVRKMIRGFGERFNYFLPLRVPVGISILYQPPASGGIDLDNLARKIVPFVNEELKPPSNHLFDIDASKIGSGEHRRWFEQKRAVIKGMPKYSIVGYQVIQLPRLTTDGKHGFVRLILETGELFESLWSRTTRMIDKWTESLR